MFSARKKQKKEVPQWKLDQMREESETAEQSGETATRDEGANHQHESSSASSSTAPPAPAAPAPAVPAPAPSPAPAAARPRSPDPNADAWGEGADDDDDDDDDFDASKYELDDTAAGEEEEEGAYPEDACCVSVTGIAHQTTGDHLREFFSSCGPVAQVQPRPPARA